MNIKLKRNSELHGSYSTSSESWFSYKMISPMLLVFVLIGLFPIIYSIWVSLLNWRLNFPVAPNFVGLANYINAFRDTVFLDSLLKTAYFVSFIVVFSIVLGYAFALLINQDKIILRSTILIFSLLPWAIPRVVGALIWKWIFDGNYGILNAILTKLNIIDSYQWWFGGSTWASLTFVAIVEIWRTAPFAGLIFFAGLQNIPRSLYESANIDGANVWQRFLYITLPETSIILMTVLILLTTWTLKSFDTIYTLTGGGPGNNTMITYMYIYKVAFQYLKLSYGSAMGYLLTLFILVIIIFYYKLFTSKQ